MKKEGGNKKEKAAPTAKAVLNRKRKEAETGDSGAQSVLRLFHDQITSRINTLKRVFPEDEPLFDEAEALLDGATDRLDDPQEAVECLVGAAEVVGKLSIKHNEDDDEEDSDGFYLNPTDYDDGFNDVDDD